MQLSLTWSDSGKHTGNSVSDTLGGKRDLGVQSVGCVADKRLRSVSSFVQEGSEACRVQDECFLVCGVIAV